MVNKTKKYIVLALILVAVAGGGLASLMHSNGQVLGESVVTNSGSIWEYECLDTMKFSRDTARDWVGNPGGLQKVIDSQIAAIKDLGANCVAIDTPYDEEFIPFMTKWVNEAREQNLKVWFRGNFSGWEGWFGYKKFTSAQEHIDKTKYFLTNHSNLFVEGDIFTPAPEAENGVLKDPGRNPVAAEEFRNFVIQSTAACNESFAKVSKKGIRCGYYSANGDVARLVFTPDSVAKTGGVIVADHYVKTAERFINDLIYLHELQKAPVVVGEFGAPIHDIHGAMTEQQQADFIAQEIELLYKHREIFTGINYWVAHGGETAVFRKDGSAKPVAQVLKNYFKPGIVSGVVVDKYGRFLSGVKVGINNGASVLTDSRGYFQIPVPANSNRILSVSGNDFNPVEISVRLGNGDTTSYQVTLNKIHPSLIYQVRSEILKFFGL